MYGSAGGDGECIVCLPPTVTISASDVNIQGFCYDVQVTRHKKTFLECAKNYLCNLYSSLECRMSWTGGTYFFTFIFIDLTLTYQRVLQGWFKLCQQYHWQ